ncbi:MAG TPA: dephospho-CoA kinase [Chitinophagaceae bacterium]|jgi:dephospho-CoA kinase|nr:dephospho-CoA kinase [Chitinophagaceae bacterium]
MVLRVGLTGGIGSGKSTVAQIFEVLGIPVYYADIAAKKLMNENAELRSAIANIFGKGAYSNNILDRKYISSIVFSDPAKLKALNSLVHPATKKDGEAWMQQQTSPYAIHEAALIFEAKVSERLDQVIGVSSPLELRIKRAMERDKVNRDEILKRMDQQLDEELKMSRCDFVLINDEHHLLIPQVLDLHEKLIALSKQKHDG